MKCTQNIFPMPSWAFRFQWFVSKYTLPGIDSLTPVLFTINIHTDIYTELIDVHMHILAHKHTNTYMAQRKYILSWRAWDFFRIFMEDLAQLTFLLNFHSHMNASVFLHKHCEEDNYHFLLIVSSS